MAKLSVELDRYFFQEERQATIKLADILSIAGERIFGFLFVILALPSALPIPAPGYSTPFGILLFLLAIQLIIGRQRPWLPVRMMNAKIKLETAQGFVKAGNPWLKRLEALTKPRYTAVCTSLPGRVILGIAIACMSVSMMIPIPGTNTLPAMGIFITGVGLSEDDGAISFGGLMFCTLILVLMVSVITAAIYGGSSLIDNLKDWLKSF
ncbi:MAG: exopolysaccharide biosynthesis protein [Jaaginema sp. PMC 1079.18]|nr:exopolysaccharide biosynthesis protein [Jaaginema sp. PMC 1080.18]MEC4851450.1 exopolysaccharide biosynthesis protein [Jaaginema sp. PMC 1079.18]MEC4868247.1 exopolysaccharide biosynthesis protein [Jaaginema sp. PMC 1078.18]